MIPEGATRCFHKPVASVAPGVIFLADVVYQQEESTGIITTVWKTRLWKHGTDASEVD